MSSSKKSPRASDGARKGGKSLPTAVPPTILSSKQLWLKLRQGARNIAGVTYQVAVTVDLLVGSAGKRADHPSAICVRPEGWEDIDVDLEDGRRLFVQVKERSPGTSNLGVASVAEVIAHAAVGLKADGRLESDALIALVTDCEFGSGLVPTGWMAAVPDVTSAAVVTALETAIAERLVVHGLDSALSHSLIARTSLVERPWNLSEETQIDLARSRSIAPATAWLAFAVLIERVSRIASDQRNAVIGGANGLSLTDLEAIVGGVTSAIDPASLEEAVYAGVCGPVDFQQPSDLSQREFLAGVDAAPSHIAGNLDVPREVEIAAIFDGLEERHHVVIAGPSGSGKSALLWRAARTLTLAARVIRVARVADAEDVILLIRHVDRSRPSGAVPVVVCADNVGGLDMAAWAPALNRLLELPNVIVISTVRREDYEPQLAAGAVVVDARLDEASARSIYAACATAGIAAGLEVEEAVMRSEGLLMEFIALITSGRRLREVLEDQLHSLRSDDRSLDRHVLRLVCAAHAIGSPIDGSRLGALLSSDDPARVGDCLRRLEGEHLVLQDPVSGRWRGIHDLRVEMIQEILHTAPPPLLRETFRDVVPLLPMDQRPRALVRAAEFLAEQRAKGSDVAPSVADFVAALRPLAELIRELLRDEEDGETSPAYLAGLLQAAIRLDALAYGFDVVPTITSRSPSNLEPLSIAGLLYSIRVDGLRFDVGSPGAAITSFAHSLPEYSRELSSVAALGMEGERLVASVDAAALSEGAQLLEAAEELVTLSPGQAKRAWERALPKLPEPPGQGFDVESADYRARISASIAALADLHGAAVAAALGPVEARATDAAACDPGSAEVSLAIEPYDADAEAPQLPRLARRATWSPTQLLVARLDILSKEETSLATGYVPNPNEGDGSHRRVVRMCRRLLDACPEVDRADVNAVEDNWKPIGYQDMIFGRKAIRSGVLRVRPAVRRNVAFQAVVARMLAASSWSERVRKQAALVAEIVDLMQALPRRLRAHDNARRAQEWADRIAASEIAASALPRRPPPSWGEFLEIDVATRDELARARDPDLSMCQKLTQGLAATQQAIAGGGRNRFLLGSNCFTEALTDLAEARRAGTPRFAALGDPLPTELADLATRMARILRACGASDEATRTIFAANSDEMIDELTDAIGESQEQSDRTLLSTLLSAAGSEGDVETVAMATLSAGRVNLSRTVGFVESASWVGLVESLRGGDPEAWDEAKGHLLVVVTHGGVICPLGLRIVGSVGSWLPIVDPDEYEELAAQSGRPLVNGPHLALYRATVRDLVAYSSLTGLRARRPAEWSQAPTAGRMPSEIRAALLEARDVGGTPSEDTEAMIEILMDLTTRVQDETGDTLGLAGRLVDNVTSDGPAVELIETAAIHALDADLAILRRGG
jgi:hypothetical protein